MSVASEMTSEDQDQELEEYIWNLMGRAGLVSEFKSQIAQFVQENGRTKDDAFSVNFSRVNPMILSLIYEYLKWVGMKNTCALLLSESPVPITTKLDSDGSHPLPQLCTYLAGKIAQSDKSSMLNETYTKSEPNSVKDESVKDESVKDESVKDESVKDESVKDESVKDDSIKDESVKDDSIKDESVKDDPFLSEKFFKDKNDQKGKQATEEVLGDQEKEADKPESFKGVKETENILDISNPLLKKFDFSELDFDESISDLIDGKSEDQTIDESIDDSKAMSSCEHIMNLK